MIKNLHLNFISAFLIGFFITSCGGKKENFDIDLSNFKVPQKSTLKISKQKNSDSSQTKIVNFENKLLPYKEKSEVLNSVKIGKKDPFAKESEVNKFSTILKLTGFADTGFDKYVFVSFQNNNGTITEGSVGGVSTNLLPNGAKVISIDTQNMNLTINFEDKDYILKL